ncbi:cytochrome b [Andreprevotia chitinilytica]|uniref:cytochrome b n=1 Tax=Andreprevotia chitinilytica TaxID=396808 RepID=UPI000551ACA6|nr:cytochrome b [Andreprevotia chitinilytica]
MSRRDRYHPLSIGLHWLIFILFAVALIAIELKGNFPKGTPQRSQLMQLHMLAGQLVLIFALVRVAARWRLAAPKMFGSGWQIGAAHLVHFLLYVLMFALPLTAIGFIQAGGGSVSFFGAALPQLLSPDPALKPTLKAIHEFLGNAVYFVVGLHVLAALFHHFIMKDDTLRRMR